VTTGSAARIAAHIIRALPVGWADGRADLSVLDVGGGDGSIAVDLARRVGTPAAVTVIDPSGEPVPGDNLVRVERRWPLEAAGGTYDLIVASAVIEHVPAAGPFVTALLARIRPGGFMYARTPFIAPFLRLIPGFDFTFPGHVHDLGPAFWARVPETFDPRLRTRHFRTSVVETGWRTSPMRTVLAVLLKLPSRLETWARGPRPTVLWPYVGGWEVVLERPADQ
jgi:SAM-dependent methyltransferase